MKQDSVDRRPPVEAALVIHPVRARAGAILRTPEQRLEEAVGHFGRAAALDRDMSEAHNNLAGALFDQGRLDEALVRLPGGRFCYLPPAYAPEPGPSTRASRDHAVFASFNNIAKIGPEVIKLWAQVLAASPDSRLVLKWKSLEDAPTRQRLVDAFAAAGVDPARLDIRGRSSHAEMLAEYADIDVCLDTFPFNGGLTTCEALWMGVPVVTLPGETPASRQGAAIMKAIGLIHLTADSPEGYVERATAIAGDPKRLADVRAILRPKMAASPLCDGAAFARSLEAAYREMWRRHCSGEPAGDFVP